MKEEVLSQINEGKVAHYTLIQIAPFLEESRQDSLGKLKAMYLKGDYTEAKLLAIAAELCTLDNIENKMRSKIRIGEKRLGELNAGRENSESRR